MICSLKVLPRSSGKWGEVKCKRFIQLHIAQNFVRYSHSKRNETNRCAIVFILSPLRNPSVQRVAINRLSGLSFLGLIPPSSDPKHIQFHRKRFDRNTTHLTSLHEWITVQDPSAAFVCCRRINRTTLATFIQNRLMLSELHYLCQCSLSNLSSVNIDTFFAHPKWNLDLIARFEGY